MIQSPSYGPILKTRVMLTNDSAPVEEPDSLCKPSSSLHFSFSDPCDLSAHLSTCHVSASAGILCCF